MRIILLIQALLISVVSSQSYSSFRSGAVAVSYAIENGIDSLSEEQREDFLVYTLFMRGFLHGLDGSSFVINEAGTKKLLTPEDWMLNPGISAPSFMAFVARHQPDGFNVTQTDTEGLKSILVAWYLDSHTAAQNPSGKSMAERSIQIAFRLDDDYDQSSGFFVCHEHGFIAKFPNEVNVARMDNPTGPLTSYDSGDADKLIFYQINIHDVVANRQLESPEEDHIRRLVKSNFDAFCKENKASNIKWQWCKTSNFPVIEFSCSLEGYLIEGLTSYQRGYAFLRGSKYYKMTVIGLEPNKDLKDAAIHFFSSLSFPDEATLKELKNNKLKRKE